MSLLPKWPNLYLDLLVIIVFIKATWNVSTTRRSGAGATRPVKEQRLIEDNSDNAVYQGKWSYLISNLAYFLGMDHTLWEWEKTSQARVFQV